MVPASDILLYMIGLPLLMHSCASRLDTVLVKVELILKDFGKPFIHFLLWVSLIEELERLSYLYNEYEAGCFSLA